VNAAVGDGATVDAHEGLLALRGVAAMEAVERDVAPAIAEPAMAAWRQVSSWPGLLAPLVRCAETLALLRTVESLVARELGRRYPGLAAAVLARCTALPAIAAELAPVGGGGTIEVGPGAIPLGFGRWPLDVGPHRRTMRWRRDPAAVEVQLDGAAPRRAPVGDASRALRFIGFAPAGDEVAAFTAIRGGLHTLVVGAPEFDGLAGVAGFATPPSMAQVAVAAQADGAARALELGRLARPARPSTPTPGPGAAVEAYERGDFAACLARLAELPPPPSPAQRALEAFAARHLGDRARFEAVVFAEPAPPPLPATTLPEPALPASWRPDGVLARLAAARASTLQLSSYAAVLAGLRPALDDWIAAGRLDRFLALAAELDLHVEIDCVFADAGSTILPGMVPTTHATARRFSPGTAAPVDGETIHLFVGRTAASARRAAASGWYPVVTGERVVAKPRIDHLRFGQSLGYPACCVDWFHRHNDWHHRNTFADLAARSARVRWQTNCLGKHTPWMSCFHIPCRLDCDATVAMAERTLAAVAELEPCLPAEIERMQRTPFLVASEALVYALVDGRRLDDGGAAYRRAWFAGGQARNDRWQAPLASGDALHLRGGFVDVRAGDRVIATLEPRCDPGVIEVPVLLCFE
jgi:hypothetical protein